MTTSSPKSKQSPQKNSSPSKGEKDISSSPSSKQNKSTSLNSNSRPSAEDLVDLDRELQKLISRKIQADTNLVKIETRLFDLETEYLNETQPFGNLILGLEGYLGLPSTTPANNAFRRGGPFNNSTSSISTVTSQSSNTIDPQQRLFSSTSSSFQKSLALIGRLPDAIANGYVPPVTSESSSDLTSINGFRSKNQSNESSSKKSSISPTKKTSSKLSTSTNSSANVNKSKKPTSETAEWQPPSMKSSRKK